MIAREEYPGGRAFEVVTGDLLKEPVDAIVNAANGHLAHGGGVAAAIARAAGPALEEEGDRLVSREGPVPVGEAVVTTAGRLPFQGVIHAVGPYQGQGQEEERLVRALQAACRRADERGWASVSFPAARRTSSPERSGSRTTQSARSRCCPSPSMTPTTPARSGSAR
mgnify:CR=1 FL=1